MNITRKMAVSSLAMMVGLGLASGAVWAQDAQGNTKLDSNSKIETQHQSKGATGSETKSEGQTSGGMKAEGGTHMKGEADSQTKAEGNTRMKGETSGQTKAEGNAQMKGETGNRTQAETNTRTKGEGQNAQSDTGAKSDQKTQMKTEESGSTKKGEGSRAQMKSETGKSGSASSGGGTNSESTTTGQNERSGTSNEKTGSVQKNGGVNVNISGEQRTEIRQVIKTENVEPVEHVTFDVDVGTSIPHSVHLHRLPPRIVKLVPAYEDYEYFVLADGRIVIVDP
ncbi:MAG: DUF1236 domain-containing protein, partial [Rhizobiales bacterium]|nr:DUF1236 domain-containing protein [Hyphomicrobiales bacterium]